jgi:hypothetical protein
MPSYPLITGKKGAYLQPTRYGKSSNGTFVKFTWHGTKTECLANVAAVEAAGGTWDMQESYSGAKCELNADIPSLSAITGGEDSEITWELRGSLSEKDLLASESPVSRVLSAKDRKTIARLLGRLDDGGNLLVPDGPALGVYELMQQGMTSIVIPFAFLRNTLFISRASQPPEIITNASRIFTTDALLAHENIPAGIAANMRNDNSTFQWSDAEVAVLQHGWMYNYPSITTSARNKLRIDREWVYGLWPKEPAMYGDFITG